MANEDRIAAAVRRWAERWDERAEEEDRELDAIRQRQDAQWKDRE